MARVGTAYIDIRPDLSGFKKELELKLAAIKASLKVAITPDVKGFADGVARMGADPTVRRAAKKSGTDVGDEMGQLLGSELGRRAGKEFVPNFEVDKHDLSSQGKRMADLFNQGMAERAPDGRKVFVTEFFKDTDTLFRERARKPLDAFRNEMKLDMRFTAEDVAHEFTETWRSKFGDLAPDEARLRRFERKMVRAYGPVGSSVARAMGTRMKRDWDATLADAFRDNDKFDKSVSSRMGRTAKKGALSFIESFSESVANGLSGVTNGMSKALANPFVLAAAAAGALAAGALIVSWVSVLLGAVAGLGVIGLAGFLVKDEPRVKAAASQLGQTFVKEFARELNGSASVFAGALEILEKAVPGWAAQFGDLVDMLQPRIIDLAHGATGFVTELLDGFKRGMPAISAILGALADELPSLGQSIGDFFTKMDPAEAASAMKGFLVATKNSVNAMGSLAATAIVWGNNIRVGFRNFNSFAKAFNPFSEARDGFGSDWSKFWNEVTGKSDEAADKVAADQQKISRTITQLQVDMSQRFTNLSFTQVSDTIDEMKVGMDSTQVAAPKFAADVTAALSKIQTKVTETDWEKFSRDAVAGFHDVSKAAKDFSGVVDDVIDSLNLLDKRFLSQQEATDNFQQGINDFNESLADTEPIYEGATDAALKHRAAVRGLASGIEESWKATLKQTQSLTEANKVYAAQRAQLAGVLADLGIVGDAAESLLNTILRTPDQLVADVRLTGDAQAKAIIEGLVLGRTVPITPQIVAGAQLAAEFASLYGPDFTDIGNSAGNSFSKGAVAAVNDTNIGAQYVKRLRDEQETFRETYRMLGAGTTEVFTSGAREGSGSAVAAGAAVGSGFGAGLKSAGPDVHDVSKGVTNDGIRPFEDADGRPPGLDLGNTFGAGISAGSGVVSGAAQGIANTARGALSGLSLFDAGKSLVSSLASGMAWAAGAATSVAKGIAATIRGFFPGSPAKWGPLAGSGDITKAGTTMAEQLADGMLKGQSDVEKAATVLARASYINPNTYSAGLGAMASIPGYRIVNNVYIGNEQLDAHILSTVDQDNEALARGLLSGRSGV